MTPTSALITGYDFLKDEATAVNDTLAQYGIANRTTLINDTWSASDFRAAFFGQGTAPWPQLAQLALQPQQLLPQQRRQRLRQRGDDRQHRLQRQR